MSECVRDVVIVGGGYSGILLALKLSSNEKYKNKSILLVEEQPTLGGRLFFASPRAFLGKNRPQIQEEILQDAHNNKFLSGFGFELFDLQTKETLFRHLQNALTLEEQAELEHYLAKFEQGENKQKENICYFVKKEMTLASSLSSGSNELLTKKEAEYLKLMLAGNLENATSQLQKEWNELSKQAKESLSIIFASCVGECWETLPFVVLCENVQQFFAAQTHHYFLPFQRQVALEIWLEKILRNRGVEIKNLCQLLRVEHKGKTQGFSLTVRDEIEPNNQILECNSLALCVPLAKCAGVLPKELYSPEQSKFVSRIQPASLVVYELTDFLNIKSPSVTLELEGYEKFVFPVEKAKAFYTPDNRMLFYTELDYESSMQTTSVREAVSRLKRAASRMLCENVLQELKKGTRMPQANFSERVILLPVAHSVPINSKINFDLKQVKMGVPNLFCCGDSFFSFGSEPWMRVIHSVGEVVGFL